MNSSTTITKRERILGGLWGSLVGDALGVPVEFINRASVQSNPVTSMREYGTHHQPRGTWSDDGALILCTVESLLHHEFNLADMGERFVRWMNSGHWTANGDVFDVGVATSTALLRIAKGIPAEQAGSRSEDSNGNGSLMRILPVALRFADELPERLGSHLELASSITHGHARAKLACALHGLVVSRLLLDWKAHAALEAARSQFTSLYERAPEFSHFARLMDDEFVSLPEGEIVSTGYVLHTLHASLWCLLTTQSFEECVLRAVNLGGDTDTTGCVAGGLAGVYYGLSAIPKQWIHALARQNDVESLFNDFTQLIESKA